MIETALKRRWQSVQEGSGKTKFTFEKLTDNPGDLNLLMCD